MLSHCDIWRAIMEFRALHLYWGFVVVVVAVLLCLFLKPGLLKRKRLFIPDGEGTRRYRE